MVKGMLQLLTNCPSETAHLRKELLIAAKHILTTDLRSRTYMDTNTFRVIHPNKEWFDVSKIFFTVLKSFFFFFFFFLALDTFCLFLKR